MPKEREIICIMCPLACPVKATVDDQGNVLDVANNMCKEGKKYAVAECKFPGRILTATVFAEGSNRAMLPVRSNKPIPKGLLMDSMRSLSQVKVKPPIKMGQIIVTNIMGTGADLIASDELPV
jgi:CxxC motif-containing protein